MTAVDEPDMMMIGCGLHVPDLSIHDEKGVRREKDAHAHGGGEGIEI